MRVLITNDDGVDSAGIRALAAVAVEPGWTRPSPRPAGTAAVPPRRSRRSSGRAVPARPRSFDDLADVAVFAVEAAPAFIVRATVTAPSATKPDLVLSGINRGPNTGHAVLHSGTVGAALTAATFGLPAMAVSIDASTDDVEWDTGASGRSTVALRWLLDADDRLVLNVNGPNVPRAETARLPAHRTRRLRRRADGRHEAGEGYVKLAYDGIDAELEPGTDAAALADGMASFTAVRAVCGVRQRAARSLAWPDRVRPLGAAIWARSSPSRLLARSLIGLSEIAQIGRRRGT